jgi:uncharacterized protein YjiS (DUF1127 family)
MRDKPDGFECLEQKPKVIEMSNLSDIRMDAVILEAREMQADVVRSFFKRLGKTLFKALPEKLQRARLRRRTLFALENLDERTLSDIGLAPGSLRRAAYAAADHAYDQERRGVTRPQFLTPAQAMNFVLAGKTAAANSNPTEKAA